MKTWIRILIRIRTNADTQHWLKLWVRDPDPVYINMELETNIEILLRIRIYLELLWSRNTSLEYFVWNAMSFYPN